MGSSEARSAVSGSFQAGAGEHANHPVGCGRAAGPSLQQSGNTGGGGGLDEHAHFSCEQPVGVKDRLLGHGFDRSVGGVARRRGFFPVGRIADANRRGIGHRLVDGMVEHHRRGTLGLEPAQHRRLRRPAGLPILDKPAPIGGDVSRIAHGQVQLVGRVAQRVHDLEGRGLLPFQPMGIDRVDENHPVAIGQLAHDGQRLIESAGDGHDTRAEHAGLRHLPRGGGVVGDHAHGRDGRRGPRMRRLTPPYFRWRRR